MPFRILSLLLCLLIAGPMSASAHAVARPENRVGKFFSDPLKSASANLDQTLEPRRESRGCDYDFASGVHKYLYCAADPVNRIDPSGREFTMVGTLTTAGIGASIGALSTVVANHALGRAQTAASIFQGAALGAVLGPLAAEYAWFGVGLGGVGVASSGTMVWQVFSNPNSTYVQKVEASALLVASVWGSSVAMKYARVAGTPAAEAAAASPATKRLFRVVSGNEKAGLRRSGEFEMTSEGSTPTGQPGKWFYGTKAEADAFALAHANENPTIIATEVTQGALKNVFPGIDGNKTGYFVHLEDLAGAGVQWLPWP